MKEIKVYSKTYGEKIVLIDDEDIELYKSKKWTVVKYHNNFYLVSKIINKQGKRSTDQFHRRVLNLKNKKLSVDHINHNGLDNRKDNLRICSHSQNSRNKQISSNNKSGYKGVYWDSQCKKWGVEICFNYKKIKLGRFNNKIAAAIAYNNAAIKYFGEFAKLNKIDENDS